MSVYDLLKDVGAFAGLGWLAKSVVKVFLNRLTTRDKQLLVAALNDDGFVKYFNIPNLGRPWIHAGAIHLGDSPLTRAQFVDAMFKLLDQGYLIPVASDLYTLSSKGLRVAGLFKSTIPIESIPSAAGKNDGAIGAQVG